MYGPDISMYGFLRIVFQNLGSHPEYNIVRIGIFIHLTDRMNQTFGPIQYLFRETFFLFSGLLSFVIAIL